MSQDHFAAHLGNPSEGQIDDPLHPNEHNGDSRPQAVQASENAPPQRRSMLMLPVFGGMIALLIVGNVGYQKLFGTPCTPQTASRPNTLLPAHDSGMTTAFRQAPYPPTPLSSQSSAASGNGASWPLQGSTTPVMGDASSLASQSLSSTQSASTPAAARPSRITQRTAIMREASAITSSPPTVDPKDAQIAQLKKALSTLRAQHSSVKRVSQAHPVKQPRRIEIQRGFHIKQIVPGQGWVENEATGKQQVVWVGDRIGDAKVTKIDADRYQITTTAGVIQ